MAKAHEHEPVSAKADSIKKTTPADLEKAAALVADCCTDFCEKKEVTKKAQEALAKADGESSAAEAKLRDAEAALIRLASHHKPAEVAAQTEV